MATRSNPVNLIMTVIGFVVFMVLLLAIVGGFGVGTIELLIWVALLVAGLLLIGVGFRRASPPGS